MTLSASQVRESEESYRSLFESIDEGFCIIEMIFDESGKPVDYRFLLINRSFENQTGLKDATGKKMRDLAPQHENHWFEIYGNIALSGEPMRFENRAEQLKRWYDVYAFRFGDPKKHRVAILFKDITERKSLEAKLKLANETLEKRVAERTGALQEKVAELERLNAVMVGREQRILDLKEELRQLREQLPKKPGS